MKKKKTSLSIQVMYWLSTFSLALLGLVLLATVVFNIMLYTDFFGNDLQLHTNFPVKVDFHEEGVAYINNEEIKIKFVEASPKIHFFNTPLFIARRIGVAIFIVTSSVCFGLGVFRKFVKNVRDGMTFSKVNINLMKILAYTISVFWLFMIVYDRLFYYSFVESIDIKNVHISEEFSNYPGVLLIALFLWVLAHIFIKGLELQDDNDLTI